MSNYKEGELVRFVRYKNWTLSLSRRGPTPTVREQLIGVNRNINIIEGKVGLIVYVLRNHLLQVTGYQVLLEGTTMFCKSIVADKYFKFVGHKSNESRGPSKV